MYPEKLKKGDGIRIVSPATSMSAMSDENINAAKTKLEELGFCVSFSENAKEINEFHSSSIESRVRDLHEAFADPDIKAILTTLGGFQSNQLLRYLDYENIKRHPNPLRLFRYYRSRPCHISKNRPYYIFRSPFFFICHEKRAGLYD